MGRTIRPKNKVARRFGENLGLKTNPSKVARRLQQPPGVHGPKKRRGTGSSYGKQLLEKQKAKIVYGLRERQMIQAAKRATRMTGDSGVNLQRLLEMRLDNVAYRLGFAETRAQARQLVGHKIFHVNDRPMNIPSHIVKAGDTIAVKANKKNKKIFDGIVERLAKKELPSWLAVDPATLSGKVLHLPEERDFERLFNVRQIIEFSVSR